MLWLVHEPLSDPPIPLTCPILSDVDYTPIIQFCFRMEDSYPLDTMISTSVMMPNLPENFESSDDLRMTDSVAEEMDRMKIGESPSSKYDLFVVKLVVLGTVDLASFLPIIGLFPWG